MEATRFYWLVLGALCIWRITHLLHAEDGPMTVFARLRRLLAGTFVAGAIECFYCLSLWVAVPFAILIGTDVRERALLWPALSAAAILVDRVISWTQPAPALFWEGGEPTGTPRDYEHGIEQNVLLRK